MTSAGRQLTKWIILTIWTLIIVIPLIILVSVTVKSPQDLLYTTLGFPKVFVWGNFGREAWKTASLGMAIGNSILITGLAILGVVLASSFAAYPLARVKSKFTSTLFLYFISGIMVPFQLSMIPLYKLLNFYI